MRSGLGGLIADLAERAVVRVERLMVCVEWPHWPLPRRASFRLRNAASDRATATAIPAFAVEVGSGTAVETIQEPLTNPEAVNSTLSQAARGFRQPRGIPRPKIFSTTRRAGSD